MALLWDGVAAPESGAAVVAVPDRGGSEVLGVGDGAGEGMKVGAEVGEGVGAEVDGGSVLGAGVLPLGADVEVSGGSGTSVVGDEPGSGLVSPGGVGPPTAGGDVVGGSSGRVAPASGEAVVADVGGMASRIASSWFPIVSVAEVTGSAGIVNSATDVASVHVPKHGIAPSGSEAIVTPLPPARDPLRQLVVQLTFWSQSARLLTMTSRAIERAATGLAPTGSIVRMARRSENCWRE